VGDPSTLDQTGNFKEPPIDENVDEVVMRGLTKSNCWTLIWCIKSEGTDYMHSIRYIKIDFSRPCSVNPIYGLHRFLMNVMTHNTIAPKYGKHKIRDFLKKIM